MLILHSPLMMLLVVRLKNSHSNQLVMTVSTRLRLGKSLDFLELAPGAQAIVDQSGVIPTV
jgi:hypothetical protein